MARKIKFTRPSSVDEHVKLGVDLINALKSLEELEEEKKMLAKDLGNQIKAKEMYIRLLRDNLEEHKISLDIECLVHKSYQEGAWLFIDPQTGAVVFREAFKENDWQLSIVEDDVDVVIDENGEPQEQKLLEGPNILQLTAGISESAEESTVEEEISEAS